MNRLFRMDVAGAQAWAAAPAADRTQPLPSHAGRPAAGGPPAGRPVVLACIVLAVLTNCGLGQSIWKHRGRGKAFMFFDTQARAVGDIVTVLINETTDVENRDQRALDRDTSASGGFNIAGAWSGALGDKSGAAEFDVGTNGKGSFDGNSAYSVERGFTDRITATIVGCLPNGDLVVRGRRDRIVAGERRALTVSGVVRPLDIRADNTIDSKFIADFKICYDGDGVESRFTDQGWLTRAWNKYRPL